MLQLGFKAYFSALMASIILTMPVTATEVKGRWLTDQNGALFTDPQPSALISWRDKLMTLADRSAKDDRQGFLHLIDPHRAQVAHSIAIELANDIAQGCFGEYLSHQPDLEALAKDRNNDLVVYAITEDASDFKLSDACQQKYQATGSTDYPTLLLKITIAPNLEKATLNGVKAISYPEHLAVGNFPNDGIEGLTIDLDNTLYMALEKDSKGQPRIFTLPLTDRLWQNDEFAVVSDSNLKLPNFASGNHPINALEFWPYKPNQHFLLAMARNDDQLWLIDINKVMPTRVIPMSFLADPKDCQSSPTLNNTSIEGIALTANTLWLINDPWKVNYRKNISCPAQAAGFESMSALLFSLPLKAEWLTTSTQ